MAQQISDLIEPLFPFVGEAPDDLLVTAYRWAARKFLTDVMSWRTDIVLADGATPDLYTITNIPTDTEAFDMEVVRYMEVPLTKQTYRQAQESGYRDTGTPQIYWVHAVNVLSIYPQPATSVLANLDGRMIMRPTKTADTVDDEVADRYSEFLEYGALWYVTRVPGEDWTNKEMAAENFMLFREAIDKYSVIGADSNMKGMPRRVRYGGIKPGVTTMRPSYGTYR